MPRGWNREKEPVTMSTTEGTSTPHPPPAGTSRLPEAITPRPAHDPNVTTALAGPPATTLTGGGPTPTPKTNIGPQPFRASKRSTPFGKCSLHLATWSATRRNLNRGSKKSLFSPGQRTSQIMRPENWPNGRWTSKMGILEDIEHALHDLEGIEYGVVALVMKRPMILNAPKTP
jgi:hypothetical protein